MTTHHSSPTDALNVRMAYTEALDGPATIRIYPPNSGRPMQAPRRERHKVSVLDCRGIADDLDMDSAGFELRTAPTTFTDYFDAEKVCETYYPQVIELLKRSLGATDAFVFDHNVRSRERCDAGQEGVRQPADGAHNDYTFSSGPRRISEVLADNNASHLSEYRAALINVWRPIRGPVQDHPLAICDARSTTTNDFIPTAIEHYLEGNLETPHLIGEVFSFQYNPAHRWYFASDMQPEEVLFLKCFDTAEDGPARFTGHSAFHNPNCPEGALPRESIEARTVVVFGQKR
jgi:hypothetical protein